VVIISQSLLSRVLARRFSSSPELELARFRVFASGLGAGRAGTGALFTIGDGHKKASMADASLGSSGTPSLTSQSMYFRARWMLESVLPR
jgi:hypothetical protein